VAIATLVGVTRRMATEVFQVVEAQAFQDVPTIEVTLAVEADGMMATAVEVGATQEVLREAIGAVTEAIGAHEVVASGAVTEVSVAAVTGAVKEAIGAVKAVCEAVVTGAVAEVAVTEAVKEAIGVTRAAWLRKEAEVIPEVQLEVMIHDAAEEVAVVATILAVGRAATEARARARPTLIMNTNRERILATQVAIEHFFSDQSLCYSLALLLYTELILTLFPYTFL
jgi:hypothetical protein